MPSADSTSRPATRPAPTWITSASAPALPTSAACAGTFPRSTTRSTTRSTNPMTKPMTKPMTNPPAETPDDDRVDRAAELSRDAREASLHALHVLEYALSAPAPRRERTWLHRVTVALDAL